ncbi:hypothetical protein [Peterkaempfera bronchialis]|uniref:hypothetical protein n=1 Tax=Peterkaempfera bronchialis TaxID=2126346 RepID=UPI003C30645A
MTASYPEPVPGALLAAADAGLRAALAGRPLVSVERFTSSGRTCYTGPAPVEAARPALAIGCYPSSPQARAGTVLAAETRTRLRGPLQRQRWVAEVDARARLLLAALERPPVIAAWYGTARLHTWAGPHGRLAAIDGALRSHLEDKAVFDALLAASGVPQQLRIPAVRVDGKLPSLGELRRTVACRRPVVQAGAYTGGRGTVFIDTERDLERAARMRGPYRVAAFVPGWSSNTTVLTVPDGQGSVAVYVDRPSHKAVGVAEAGIGPAKSAGNHWSRPWPRDTAAALVDAAVRIGHWAWEQHRMAGLFGLDAMLTEDGRVLLNEINCRNQGTTEVSGVNQQLRGLPPFVLAHLTVLLGGRVDWLPDVDDFNTGTVLTATSGMPGPFYLKLRHCGQHPAVLDDALPGPGVYRLHAGRLHWVQPGTHPADARPGEVLLANLPRPGTVCLPDAELGTAEGITATDAGPFAGPHDLSETGRALVDALARHLIPTTASE